MEEADGKIVRLQRSGRPVPDGSVLLLGGSHATHTVFALTSTETSDEGRLTRQFFRDCCSTISACTTWPAGFFGGAIAAIIVQSEVQGKSPPHVQQRSLGMPRLSAPTYGSSPGGHGRQKELRKTL